jgi:hypothetical protein
MSLTMFTIWLLFGAGPGIPESSLEGCPSATKLAEQLRWVRAAWSSIALEDLAKRWAAGLRKQSCESDKGKCLILVSEDRIVRGRPECTTGFDFEGSGSDGSQWTLRTIVVNHTSPRLTEAVAAARVLAAALEPLPGSGPDPASLNSSESAPMDVRYPVLNAQIGG